MFCTYSDENRKERTEEWFGGRAGKGYIYK